MKRVIYREIVPKIVSVLVLFLGSRNKKKINSSDFFFIVGSGRNGSTLLSSILNNSPEIFIPPEQYVIPFFAVRWQLFRFISRESFFKRVYLQLLMPHKTSNWVMKRADYDRIDIQLASMSFYSCIKYIFYEYARKHARKSVKLVGDKSPLMIHYWQLFQKEFKKSKYIFLIRDPRDVIYSFLKIDKHKANKIEVAIAKWKDSVIQFKKLTKKKVPIIIVKYEDLVNGPEKELQRIHLFLGLEFRKEIIYSLRDSSLLGVDQLSHHENLLNPINNSSVGRWRGNYSEKELKLIRKNLGEYAIEFGYKL